MGFFSSPKTIINLISFFSFNKQHNINNFFKTILYLKLTKQKVLIFNSIYLYNFFLYLLSKLIYNQINIKGLNI